MARRLGEDVPRREAILEDAGGLARRASRRSRGCCCGTSRSTPVRLLPAGEDRPRSQPAARAARRHAADAHPVRQRGPARAARGAAGGGRPRRRRRHAGDRRARRRLRDAHAPGAHRPRDLPPRAPAPPPAALPAGRPVGRDRRAHRRRLRRAPRARHRDLPRHRDDLGGRVTLEVAVVEYEGGDRLNVPLYRLDQLERYRAAGDDGDRPPPRLHRLGGSSLAAGPREDPPGDPADGGRAARPLRAAHRERAATPSRRTRRGSGSSSRASSSRTRPTSARPPTR